MKRILSAVWLIMIIFSSSLSGQGLDRLAARSAENVVRFFSDKYEVKAAVVRFENYTDLSGQAAQKYYQLFTSGLESQTVFQFDDLMVDIQQNAGAFNLTRLDKYNFLIYLRLIRHRDNIGAGIAVFSRVLDRIVHIQYLEEFMPPGEKEIFDVADYGFAGAGFDRRFEIKVDRELLAVKDEVSSAGEQWFFFLYPSRVDVYKIENEQLKKFQVINLNWGRPYWPSLTAEGRVAAFRNGETLYFAAGCNSSPRSQIFILENEQWRAAGSVDFIVFELIRLNNVDYLLGGRYEEGKNSFRDIVCLSPFNGSFSAPEPVLEKKAVPFYALDVSLAKDYSVISLLLVDKNYRIRMYGADFQEIASPEGKRGGALAVVKDSWLAFSDFSRGADKLYFNKIDGGGHQPVYQNIIEGEVLFISGGTWRQQPGFWICIKRDKGGQTDYTLQFWSENNG